MQTFENVRRVLKEEGISFTQVEEPEGVGFGFGTGLWLQIDGGRREAPLYIEFGKVEGEYMLFDLHFGRYSYELWEYEDDSVLSELMQNIHAAIEGKAHIIWSWYTKSHRWNADACYYVAPGENDDDSDDYHAALRRIERPKNALSRFFTRRVTYAIYNWHSYREITR